MEETRKIKQFNKNFNIKIDQGVFKMMICMDRYVDTEMNYGEFSKTIMN